MGSGKTRHGNSNLAERDHAQDLGRGFRIPGGETNVAQPKLPLREYGVMTWVRLYVPPWENASD